MSDERVIIIDAGNDAPRKGQTMADVLIGDQRARCVVEFEDDLHARLIQRDSPIERRSNVWRAVYNVLGRIHRGEVISFPLDITSEVEQGPWPC